MLYDYFFVEPEGKEFDDAGFQVLSKDAAGIEVEDAPYLGILPGNSLWFFDMNSGEVFSLPIVGF